MISFLFPDAPVVQLSMGRPLDPTILKEGDDVFFECSIIANPPYKRVIWYHNVSAGQKLRNFSVVPLTSPTSASRPVLPPLSVAVLYFLFILFSEPHLYPAHLSLFSGFTLPPPTAPSFIHIRLSPLHFIISSLLSFSRYFLCICCCYLALT